MRRIIVFSALLVMAFVLSMTLPDYRLRLLTTAALFGVLAAAIDIPAGCCGVPVFGASLPFAIGAYVASIISRNGENAFVALAITAAISASSSAAFSWLAFRLRVSVLQFGLISLLLTLAIEQLVSASPKYFGGSNGITGIRGAIPDDKLLLITLCGTLLLFLLLMWIRDSEFGLIMRAVRDNEKRATALGFNATNVRVLAVTLGSITAGIAGALYAPVAGIVSPSLFGLTASLVVSVWIALGRSGSVWGPAIVAMMYKLFQSELGSLLENAYLFVFGLLIFGGSRWLLGRSRDSEAQFSLK